VTYYKWEDEFICGGVARIKQEQARYGAMVKARLRSVKVARARQERRASVSLSEVDN